jgi:hypothetical protein
MDMKRLGILTSLFMAGGLAFASPVLAAAPGNDTYGGRTVIGSLPFSESVDTTEATTDTVDTEASICGAVTTDASVWYELTAKSDGQVEVNTKPSTYLTGLIVVTGSPGSFAPVACDATALVFDTSAGVTYAILVVDFQGDGGGNGGMLDITVQEVLPPPPPPVVDVTVDPVGHFNASTGSATITGGITCTGVAEFGAIQVELKQTVGRFVIGGLGSIEFFTCDGTAHPWSAEVASENGLFKGGRAASSTVAYAFGPGGFDDDSEQRTVTLRR